MKSLIVSIAILAVVGMAVGVAVQADETVTATVTVQEIAITVTDGGVVYETMIINTSKDTTSSGINDTQTVTNTGNVAVDLNIRGQDSTSAGAGWTLAGAAASETYAHKFCKVATGDCDGTPTWDALTTINQTLTTGVALSGTYDFDLEISTPTATTDFNEQSVDVTVVATAT